MGKPFKQELSKLQDTLKWASFCDVKPLRSFLLKNINEQLLCVGSGGSSSACALASLIYRELGGFSMHITPLALQQMSEVLIRKSRLLYISASGNNRDILQSLKYGLETSSFDTASLCTSLKNKIASITDDKLYHHQFHYGIPTNKDGFLATNSLLAFFVLLVRAYDISPIGDLLDWNSLDSNAYEIRGKLSLSQIDNFIVIYGKHGEPVAVDLESKMSEAGLAAALLSDYRNFGHGRHNWFDKRGNNSCLIAIVTPEDEMLADKTLSNLPIDLPMIILKSSNPTLFACVELLVRALYLISDLGESKSIDPGKPGVPDYGTALYHLSYKKLLLPHNVTTTITDIAIQRKAQVSNTFELTKEEYIFYRNELRSFTSAITQKKFGMVAFDYDGTLSDDDIISRHNNFLLPEIKQHILLFLESGIKVSVISGRGRSLYQLLIKEIPVKYQHLVFVGCYNGSEIYPLDTKINFDAIKDSMIQEQLYLLREELIRTCPFVKPVDIESRQFQLTIAAKTNIDKIASRCQEIIIEYNFLDIRIWRSSHSMDLVVSSIVDKRNIKKYYDGDILFIGDSGAVLGNDFQMLSEQSSLSVDKVSYNPTSCWNLAPAGCKGVAATLYYLKNIKLQKGYFTIKLKV